jgi:CubicO group peptidase (beta-lactamase class C family)
VADVIEGFVADGFATVAEAFAESFASRGEVGAAVTVIVDHEVVVELWGGTRDQERREPWTRDTMVDYYSAGKAVIATTLLDLVNRGKVNLDEPVATYWPEFSAGGKEHCTVRHALTHQAGVPAIRTPLTNDDLWNWETMASALASTPAWFEPGTRVVYHTNTFGHLIGEITRRVSGLAPHDAIAALANTCGADLHDGLTDQEIARCAYVHLDVAHSPARVDTTSTTTEAEMIRSGYFNPPGYSSFGVVNSPEWRRAQVPSTNGHGTATGLARLYDALITPDRVLSSSLLDEATSVQAAGDCPVLGEFVQFGLGFVPTSERRRFGTSPRAFGHFGTGGSVGCADPDRGVAVGYVMNHVIPRWQSTRNRAILDALAVCVA